MMAIIKLQKKRIPALEKSWSEHEGTRRFGQPYGLADSVSWLFNNVFGPSTRHAEATESIPQQVILNNVRPMVKLAFVGDIMPFGHYSLAPGTHLKTFLADVDVVIGNLEGCIEAVARHHVFLGQRHSHAAIDFLQSVAPNARIIVSCANNHAADYGWISFSDSYDALQDSGVEVIGRRDEAAILIDDRVSVAACTAWSNQECHYLSTMDTVLMHYNKEADINILFPHWGHEMELYPRLNQIEQAKALLLQWDMIVGHHSHCPQPIAAYASGGRNRAVAYSLGNFTSGLDLVSYQQGIVMIVELGPDIYGKWMAGEVRWRRTHVDLARELVDLTSTSI
jgi:poly-gamma-glutamate capsule biosynthesis protein CapA/YwtB (metallophosphatase superfamily)